MTVSSARRCVPVSLGQILKKLFVNNAGPENLIGDCFLNK